MSNYLTFFTFTVSYISTFIYFLFSFKLLVSQYPVPPRKPKVAIPKTGLESEFSPSEPFEAVLVELAEV